jgi:peptide/nickel transport system substrate-binding protein
MMTLGTETTPTNERTRMRKLWRLLPLAVIGLAALVVAGCGGGGGGASSTKANAGASGKTGGTVTILDAAGSVDSLDPGYWYYQTDYTELGQTTQRWLYGWKPTDNHPTPDIAQGLPQLSDGGKTLTIKIKPGIKYSAPLQNRTVKAADIKYAMERCFAASVGNGYASAYWNGIVGAPSAPSTKGVPDISGIQAPDDTTLVLKVKNPVGVLANANALGLPCTAPVPKDYASKYDSKTQSTYGQHQVFTGPYMIQGAGSGTIPKSGYQPAKLITLVRNPSWDKSTDFKPAYFDKIIIKNGSDVTVASRQILQGQSMMSGDYAVPPPAILKQGLSTRKDQFQISPSGGNRYIALNTQVKPFDNENVRKAVAAVVNRNALRQTRGGPAVGTVATHFIPPLMPGFQQAGGNAGPGYDFYKNPNGDVNLAKEYMKKAGFANGMYSGGPVLAVADNTPPAKQTAEAVQQQLKAIGINLNLKEVPHATMYSKFCQVPKAKVALCPNMGWGKDFFDAQSMIDPVFNGKNIVPSGNVNSAQVNDPKINARIDAAASITDPNQRAQTYGQLDKDLTGGAYYITWLWDNEVNFTSKNVNGVQNAFNGNAWDLTYSSLK